MKRLMIAVPLALAACSEPADSVPEVEKSDTIATTNTPGAAAMPANSAAPVATPTGGELAAVSIPAAYRGRWALVPADCDPSRADNKGLMTVEADIIRFYESRARVRSATETAPTLLSADLAFSGEGQTWRESTRFTLSGDTLKRETRQPPLSLTYRRCPA